MNDNAQFMARPAAGAFGKTYTTHGQEIGLSDLVEISQHARLTPQEAREQLLDLVRAIPDEDLTNYIAAQVTVVC